MRQKLSVESTTHVYSRPGNFTIRATPQGGTIQSPQAEQFDITVQNVLPTAPTIYGPPVGNEGTPVNFGRSQSSDPGTPYTQLTYDWEVFNAQQQLVASLYNQPYNQTSFLFTPPDNDVYTVKLSVDDHERLNPTDALQYSTRTLTINNVAPALTLSGPASIAEGSEYLLALDIWDPGTDALVLANCTVDWGDGTAGEAYDGSGAMTHRYADGPTAYTITVDLADEDGAYDNAGTISVDVLNVEPVLTLGGYATAADGLPYALRLYADDPGDDAITSWTIDWGDGSLPQVVTDITYPLAHTFAPGYASVTILVSANDEDGSYQATKAVDIVPAPAAVSNVTAAAVSAEEALLAWDAPAGPVDGFSIWLSADGGEYQEFDYVPAGQTSYRFFNDATGVFRFWVRAWGGPYLSAPTDAVDPSSGLVAQIPIIGSLPPTPAGLSTAGTTGIDGVTLAWQPSYGATGYVIDWSDDGIEWFAIDEVADVGYTDPYPALGEQYYRILAYRKNLDPVYSAPPDYLPVHPVAPPVAWSDDNSGPNERGTLSPLSTVHDTPLSFSVLSNDIDYDGSMVTVASYTNPSHGALSFDAGLQEFTYTPADGFVGTDTFTYVINDGSADSAPATVAIDVTNSTPVAHNGTVMYWAGSGCVGEEVDDKGVTHYHNRRSGTLEAEDADQDALTFRIVDAPAHGSLLEFDAQTGEFQFEIAPDFAGFDFFTFVASDGVADSLPSKVVIVANMPLVQGNFADRTKGPTPPEPYKWITDLGSYPGHYTRVLPGYSGGDVDISGQVSWIATKEGYDIHYYDSTYRFAPDGGYGLFQIEGNDVNFTYKPFTYALHPVASDDDPVTWWTSDWWSGGTWYFAELVYNVPATETQAFTAAQTRLFPAGWGGTLSLGQQAAHGTVTLSPDGAFSYDPHANAGDPDPYLGWDFFSVKAREAGGFEQEQWVQLNVGLQSFFIDPPPQIVTKAESCWIPTPFNGTLDALEAEYNTVKGLAVAVLNGWKALGTKVQEVYDARENTDEAVLGKVDGAISQLTLLESDYLTYLAGFNDLNSHTGSYQPTWTAYWDNLADGDRYWRVLSGIQALPRDIGGLKSNKEYDQKLAQALADFGSGAGIAVDNAGRVVTIAKDAHQVLEVALAAGGMAALTYTAAQLAVEQGLAVCARKVVTSLVVAQVANYAAQRAEALAVDLGVDPDRIRIAADALQVVMLWRAAKAARAGCFVAGTQVLTGYGPDGTPVTQNIEDLRRGDLVLSRSESDAGDALDPRPVLGVSERTVYRLAHVDVADGAGNIEQLQATVEHPFWVLGRGWTEAKGLKPADVLLDEAGRTLSVAAVQIEARPEGIVVYNLTVDADHTYFVEDGAGTQRFAWVHNAPDCYGLATTDVRQIKTALSQGNGDVGIGIYDIKTGRVWIEKASALAPGGGGHVDLLSRIDPGAYASGRLPSNLRGFVVQRAPDGAFSLQNVSSLNGPTLKMKPQFFDKLRGYVLPLLNS